MRPWKSLKKNIQRIVSFLLILLMTAACMEGGGDSGGDISPTSTPYPTAEAVARPTVTVQRGTVQDDLSFTGRWQPRDQLPLAFEINGTVRNVNVRRGDLVTAGQLLADYQIDDLEAQLADAQLDLEAALENLESGEDSGVQAIIDAEIALAEARLDLERTKANNPWTNVANAKISVENAERSLDNAQRAYDEAISYPDNPASAVDNAYQSLQSAESSLQSAQISYQSAAQSYNDYQYTLIDAENRVIKAELELERVRESAGTSEAERSVISAQMRIDEINEDIAQSSLYAPFDGVVLEVNIQPGSGVQAYEEVMVLAIPEPQEIIANLSFNDVQQLSVGLTGVCQVVNQPDTAVGCAIRQIPVSTSEADQTTRVAASFEGLPNGQLVQVEMPLEVREDVLWLPPAFIRTFQGRVFVVVQTPDGQRSVDVTLGLQTQERVEIVSGLQEGDVVVGP
jgi:multidrug efflux pump subunit AcrA (membrane-fusion protein)